MKLYTCITVDAKRYDIVALNAISANSIAEKRFGYANICVAPQESMVREVPATATEPAIVPSQPLPAKPSKPETYQRISNMFERISHPTASQLDLDGNAPFVRFEYSVNGVNCIRKPMYHHTHNLSYTASGYGDKIPTEYMVRVFNQRWHRVYCICHSNVGTCYVVIKGKNYIVDIS